MEYLKEWKLIKKNFEGETGKKKPSAKFIGVIKKSTGMETACGNIDKALGGKKAADVVKAVSAFEVAAKAYEKTLAEAIKSEDSTDARTYNACVKVMMGELAKLAKDARKDGDELENKIYFNAAEKCAVDISKLQQKALEDKRIAEGQAADCDSALRATVEAVVKKDQVAAKKHANAVAAAAKSVADIQKRIAATHKTAKDFFNKSRKEWAGADSKSTAARMNDKCEMLVDAMEMMVTDLQEDVDECKKAFLEAGKALKGGVDEHAIYVSGGAKLAARAIKAVATLDASYREVTGNVDNVKFDVMNANDLKNEDDKKKALGNAKSRAEGVAKEMVTLLKNLETNKTNLDKEFKKFPVLIVNHKDFAAHKTEIEQALGFFDEMTVGTKAAQVTLGKIQDKLK